MAEAYKGLTIRIGADAQPLTRVLKNVNSAARSTAREMRNITAALKKDPGNTSLLNMQLRAMADNSRAAANKVNILQREFKQLVSTGPGGMKNLAAAMQNIETETAIARNNFNSLDQALEGVYDTVIKYNTAVKGMSTDEAATALRTLRREAKNSADEVGMLEKELRKVWSEKPNLIPFNTKSVDEAIIKWKELRKEAVAAEKVLENCNRVSALKNLSLDIELAKVQMKEMHVEAIGVRNALAQIGTSPAAKQATAQQKLLAQATKDAQNQLEAAVNISNSLPRSFEAASMKARSLEQVTKLLENQLDGAQAKLKTLDGSTVGKIEKEFITTGNAVRVTTDRVAEYRTQIDLAEDELKSLKAIQKSFSSGDAYWEVLENEISKVNNKLKETRTNLSNTEAKLAAANKAHAYRTAELDVQKLNSQLAANQRLVATASQRWVQFGASIRTAGYSMTSTVGAMAIMGGMYAIQAATDIDSAYRNMRKTVNGTEEQFEHLRDAALKFSQTHFTSADQILEIESIGGQLGIAVQNLEKFAETVSNVDIATNLDTETISQNLGQLTNIMNDMNQDLQSGPGSMEAYGDALVRLGNNTAAQEDKIQNVMMRIASMGTICNMSTPDLLALAAATAATGQGAEAAGTALSRTFSGIESAVNGSERALAKLAESGDLTEDEIEDLTESIEKSENKLKVFAEVAGMSAEEFKAAWNGDNVMQDAFKPFIEGLRRIADEGGSVDSVLSELGINSVRQKQTLQGLTQTVDILGNAVTMSNDAWNGVSDQWGAAGDAAREAERKAEGFSGQLEMLKNNAKVLASELLEALTPALISAVDVVRDVVSAFKDLPDGVKQAIVLGGVLTALSGPMMTFGGNAISATASFVGFLNKTKGGTSVLEGFGQKIFGLGSGLSKVGKEGSIASGIMGKLGGGVKGVGQAMFSLSGAALPVTLAFGTLGAAIGLSIKQAADLYEGVNSARRTTDKLNESSKKLKDSVRKSFSSIGDSINSNLTANLEDAQNRYEEFAEKIVSSREQLASAAEQTASKIGMIRQSASDAASLMEKLQKNGSLTELEYEQLSLAIDNYNQTTGDSVQLTKNEDGAIRVLKDGVDLTADSFRELAKAQEIAAKKEYFTKAANAGYENRLEAIKELQQAQRDLAEAQATIDNFGARPDTVSDGGVAAQNYDKQLAEAQGTLDAAKERVKGYVSSLNSLTKEERAATEMLALFDSAAAKQEGTLEHLIYTNENVQAAFEGSNSSISDFKKILEKAGVSADSLTETDLVSVVGDWDGSISDLAKHLNDAKLISDEARASLEGLSLLHIGDKTFIVGDDGTIDEEEAKLAGIQQFVIDGKHYYVTDDGSIYDQESQIFDLESMKIGDKYFIVNDEGTALNAQGELIALDNFQIGDKPLYITTDGLKTAEGDLYTFDDLGLSAKDFEVTDEGTIRISEDKLGSLNKTIESVPKNVEVKATADTSDATAKFNNLKDLIASVNSKAVDLGASMLVTAMGQNATGGFRRLASQRNLALHAAGAFITNGTTYIGSDRNGVHHIAGEAGREFVQHHADGTTSIIPLQNRKYMAPFVSAVADMLSGGSQNVISKDDLYKVADAVIRSNQQQGDIVLVIDDREMGRIVRKFA